MLFDRKPGKLLFMLKVREEDALNDALFIPLSNYRERESQQADWRVKTISRFKADCENAVLSPRKPRRDRKELSDFDKCEICINCKITQQTIKTIKKMLILGF